MESEGKQYEIAYLISPKVREEDVFGEAGKITGFIQDIKGFVVYINEPKKIRLAYPIAKSREAHFGWTRFTAMPGELAEFEKKLKLEKGILRYLVVEAEEEPIRTRIMRLRPELPQKPKEGETPEEPVNMEQLDKRLEEILGK